ncbi:SMP-30/gluconolactonase/LRE family protein [Hamadaea tsunoensis]|uniref:SMP-30/gluconolactonase/LRE family protein n=1 Tax=Hamadaea tsunoensis TaxID=53368 RepID=UPI000413FC94|nr:PQQ-binding-like beta-propeller repeat protein [Hamadaea tsunoensis]
MIETYLLPGDDVFPEGITEDPDGVTFYVGSSANGTIYRGRTDQPELEVWATAPADLHSPADPQGPADPLSPADPQSPAGLPGPSSVLGLTVDGDTLIAAGSDTGWIFAFDLRTARIVGRVRVPSDETLLNDVCVAHGYAYVTDSARPVVWRLSISDGRLGDPVAWAHLDDGAPTPYLNGIVAVHDGATLIVAAQGSEVLWRVDTATGQAVRLDLRIAADGMVVVGDRLYTCDNVDRADGGADYYVSELVLSADAHAVRLERRWPQSAEDTPTTCAYLGGRLLMVNSRFGARRIGTTVPPFSVRALSIGEDAR